MEHKLPCAVLLCAALLAGCAAGETASQPDQSPAADRSAPALKTVSDKPAEVLFVDDPASPYPMVVDSWSVDLDGDGVDELVELRAEKTYFGNESEPDKWFEGDGVMHPYTLVVTQGETVWELPLGWEDNGSPPLRPIYWDEERTGRGWTQDRAGRPVLVLWFDSFSRVLDIYALGLQGGKPVLLPVPEGEFQAEPDHWSEWYT